MYVELRSSQAVHLNLKNTCGLREQSMNVVSSVHTITVGPLLNSTKRRPVNSLSALTNFTKRGNKYAWRQV
jgi:uncharacterized membrane protein